MEKKKTGTEEDIFTPKRRMNKRKRWRDTEEERKNEGKSWQGKEGAKAKARGEVAEGQ